MRIGIFISVLVLNVLCALSAGAKPGVGPDDNPTTLAGQLLALADRAQAQLNKLPAATSPAEKAVANGIANFGAEGKRLQSYLSVGERKRAGQSAEKLNKIAWALHGALKKAPRYKALIKDWARVVSGLRRLRKRI